MSTDHPVSRRTFVAAATSLAASSLAAARRVEAQQPAPLMLHVGTYTEKTASAGVYRFHMDPASGALAPLGSSDVGPNPSFLARPRSRPLLVAVNEVGEWEGQKTGAVSAFTVDARSGALTLRGRKASGGGAPAYVALDGSGRWALVANYSGGSVAVLPLAADGGLGDATSVVKHQGALGPNTQRQEAAHAHCILPDPSNRFVLATDLGIDRIFVYRLDATKGTLTPAATPFVAAAPGAGPRHLAFHPNGRIVYVANELDLTLGAYRWDSTAGTLTLIENRPLYAGLKPGPQTAADIHVAPSGKFLYATVRGDDSVVVHAIDAAKGTLTPVQRIATEGKWPRNFALDPSGRFLLVANQHTNDITLFRVDATTGRLTFTGQKTSVPAPVCLRFA